MTEIEALERIVTFLGSVTYGKERFFRQENGIWYDRDKGDYITLEQIVERAEEIISDWAW